MLPPSRNFIRFSSALECSLAFDLLLGFCRSNTDFIYLNCFHCSIFQWCHVPVLELQFAKDYFFHLYCDNYCLLLWNCFCGRCSDVEVILCSFGNWVYISCILLLEYSVYFRVKFLMSVNQLHRWTNMLYYELFTAGCVPLTVSYHLYFFRVSKSSSMLHHRSLGLVHSKECYFIFAYTFLAFFAAFRQKGCVFIIFISFLMKYPIAATEY